jgi:hypothetical protein
MSNEQQNINVLENFIAKPQSLEAERVGRRYLLDSHDKVIPNEANLLSLTTLKEFYADDDESKKAFQAIGKNETKYLTELAMKILSEDTKAATDAKSIATKKLQQKFGRDFNAAIGLSNMLKNNLAEELEYDELIKAVIPNDIKNRHKK